MLSMHTREDRSARRRLRRAYALSAEKESEENAVVGVDEGNEIPNDVWLCVNSYDSRNEGSGAVCGVLVSACRIRICYIAMCIVHNSCEWP